MMKSNAHCVRSTAICRSRCTGAWSVVLACVALASAPSTTTVHGFDGLGPMANSLARSSHLSSSASSLPGAGLHAHGAPEGTTVILRWGSWLQVMVSVLFCLTFLTINTVFSLDDCWCSGSHVSCLFRLKWHSSTIAPGTRYKPGMIPDTAVR